MNATQTADERTAHRRPHGKRARAAVIALVVGISAAPARSAHGPPLTSTTGAVAADDPTASAIGAAVLADGGNAMDAAVATALALGVVNPTSSGIGGGGFAIVYDASTGQTHAFDFRETAPAALDAADFVRDGVIDPMRARRGGLAVGVPGEVAGLATLSRRFGRLSWRRVVAPSIALARDGYPTSWFFAQAAPQVLSTLPDTPAYAGLRALLTDGAGAPRRAGQPMARPALAATLAALARDPRALARGPIADDIVATVTADGGVLTAADLAAYTVIERPPLRGAWHGLELATMPIPSSGGVVLLEALALLDGAKADLPALGAGSSAALHLIVEAAKHGFADRARALGDTDAGRAAAAAMLEPGRLATMARTLDPRRTLPSDRYGIPAPVVTPGPGGTSHLCVIDRDGNAVALTTTVNGYHGSKLVTPTGIVLNNQIDDFALAPGAVNMYGLRQGQDNVVGPGKRPLSSMTPVLVFEGGKVVGCVGGSGGPRIISNVLQVLIDLFVFDLDPRAAVGAPRVHHQWQPDQLTVDADLAADVRAGLAARGHTVVVGQPTTAVQAIRVLPDGSFQAASDPRKNGAPAAPAR